MFFTSSYDGKPAHLLTNPTSSQAMLSEYASNPKANWKAKDTAIYLVLALTVQGTTGETHLRG